MIINLFICCFRIFIEKLKFNKPTKARKWRSRISPYHSLRFAISSNDIRHEMQRTYLHRQIYPRDHQWISFHTYSDLRCFYDPIWKFKSSFEAFPTYSFMTSIRSDKMWSVVWSRRACTLSYDLVSVIIISIF